MVDQKMDYEEFFQILTEMYEQKIPFNKMLGLRVASLKLEEVKLNFEMKEEFIGNYIQGILHGGVISSVLDATGGITATIGTLQKMAGYSIEEIKKGITKVGTIDLRVDYLRPGRGEYFISTGSIMRVGRKVSVTRMELHNEKNLLLAVGTGTYIVG
jgi:uncharacterized protein (TIGR00369 family)